MLHPVPRQLPLSHEATALAVSADGKRLAASALGNGRTVIYDLRVGRVLFRFAASATALVFSPDGGRLVTAAGDRRAPSGKPGIDVSAEASSARVDGNRRGRTTRVWDVVTGRCLTPEPWLGEAPIALSPDGRLLAVAAGPETASVLVLRLQDGAVVRALALPEQLPLRSLVWSPDGRWLVAMTGASPAVFWSVDDFRRVVPPGFRDDDIAAAFALRGGLVAAAGIDCRVHVGLPEENARDRAVLSVRHGRRLLRGIEALEFSPDGALLVARGRTGATQVFSVSLARPLWTASPGPLAFLPQGKTIAAWWCGAVWLRDAESGDMIVSTTADDGVLPEGGGETFTGAPPSRTVTLRSRELEGPREGDTREAPVITEAASEVGPLVTIEAAVELLARLSTGWAETGYRKSALVIARDPDGLGVRLPLRGGYAYVQVRPLGASVRVVVRVTADEPDLEPPPSSSLVRFSRWIRDRLSAEARRQASLDREWAAELPPDTRGSDVRVERGPGSLTMTIERTTLPSRGDLEALVHAAEQKLAF